MHLGIAVCSALWLCLVAGHIQSTLITSTTPHYSNGSFSTLERDNFYNGYSTNRPLQCYCVTQLRNWLLTSDPLTRTRSVTRGIGSTTLTITRAGGTFTTSQAKVVTAVVTKTGNGDTADWYGSAKSPCCSSCTVAAMTVGLFYFPTPALKSAATSFVSNNYTFISPSVHIAFTSLYAYDFCGNVGEVLASTTLAFDASEISTLGNPVSTTTIYTQQLRNSSSSGEHLVKETATWMQPVGLPTMINLRDLGQDCSAVDGSSNPSLEQHSPLNTYDRCRAIIVLPSRIKALNTKWKSCVDNAVGGFYHPPSALTHISAPAPLTTSSELPCEAIETKGQDPTSAEPPHPLMTWVPDPTTVSTSYIHSLLTPNYSIASRTSTQSNDVAVDLLTNPLSSSNISSPATPTVKETLRSQIIGVSFPQNLFTPSSAVVQSQLDTSIAPYVPPDSYDFSTGFPTPSISNNDAIPAGFSSIYPTATPESPPPSGNSTGSGPSEVVRRQITKAEIGMLVIAVLAFIYGIIVLNDRYRSGGWWLG